MDLLYADNIVLKNNRLETLGSARTAAEVNLPDAQTPAMYGTYAIGMARFCRDILIKNNRIMTTWNRDLGATKNPGGDLGLMHPFYIIDAGDTVFMDNHAQDSSGPLFKVVDTVSYGPDGKVTGSQTAALRQVIMHNDFVQTTDRLAGIYPIDADVMAMIHDNSAQVHFLTDKKLYTQPSPPAPNLIFLGNTWEARIKMDFLRRESETTAADGRSPLAARFPKWLFEGNTWIGFAGGPRIVERERGTAISVKKDITQEGGERSARDGAVRAGGAALFGCGGGGAAARAGAGGWIGAGDLCVGECEDGPGAGGDGGDGGDCAGVNGPVGHALPGYRAISSGSCPARTIAKASRRATVSGS